MNLSDTPVQASGFIRTHLTVSVTSKVRSTVSGIESLPSTSEKTPLPSDLADSGDSLLKAAESMRAGMAEVGRAIVKTFESVSKMLGEALLSQCPSEMDLYNGFWPEREPLDIPERVIGAGDYFLLTVVLMNDLPLPSLRTISDRAYYQITVPSFLDGEIASELAWEAGLLSGHQYTYRLDIVNKDEFGFHWAKGQVTEVSHPLECSMGITCPATAHSTEGDDFFVTLR